MSITELRVEVDSDEVSVLDWYCSATGKKRTDVIRHLLKELSNSKLHEATLILRVAGHLATPSENNRK